MGAYLNTATLQRLRELERQYAQADIPLAVRLAYMMDCVDLIPRLPPAVRKEFEAVKKLDAQTATSTARKKIIKQCEAWIANQMRQPGGWEHNEVLSMQMVLEILKEYERPDTGHWTEHFQSFLQGMLLNIEESLNEAIQALTAKHFSDY